jgi:hypothetical protein
MKLQMTIAMDNEAFMGAPGYELARILRELAGKLENEISSDPFDTHIRLRDVNGNTVGEAVIR